MGNVLETTRGTRFGRYHLVRPLGRGGMGEVFEASHVDLGTRVAIKVMHASVASSRDAARRMLREGRAAAAIRHPNVVAVLDVGMQGTPFLVMELLEGEDLAKRLARDAPLGISEAVDLLLPIISGVAAAHAAGIVHRDLKPSNVYLARRRGIVEPVVVDFGISQVLRHSPSATSSSRAIVGTPQYMAPEQLRRPGIIDPQSDQYALAVLLYECITGGTPFWSDDYYELLHAIMTANLVSASEINPLLPTALDPVLARALARSTHARFASVRDFGTALLPFASESARVKWALEAGLFESTGGSSLAVTASPSLPAAVPSSRSRAKVYGLGLGLVVLALAAAGSRRFASSPTPEGRGSAVTTRLDPRSAAANQESAALPSTAIATQESTALPRTTIATQGSVTTTTPTAIATRGGVTTTTPTAIATRGGVTTTFIAIGTQRAATTTPTAIATQTSPTVRPTAIATQETTTTRLMAPSDTSTGASGLLSTAGSASSPATPPALPPLTSANMAPSASVLPAPSSIERGTRNIPIIE